MSEVKNADPFGWVGATVEGKYRIDAVVGEGGFGVVYRAHHLGFEETVAFKCLRMPEVLVGEDRDRFFQSFLAEGRLLHRLSRSTAGIVQALDVGGAVSPKGVWTPYIVLEWLDGVTLDEELEQRQKNKLGGIPFVEAVELLEPAARALGVAHEQGVAHRDVKPANLFLADVGGRRTLKVLDFGIAKVITETASLTRLFEATGSSLQAFTARYGAPEQFSRRFGATGPWTDVFALALVFVEVVSGRFALDGEDAAQMFIAAADETHRPTLRSLNIETSDGVEAVLRCAMSVDPKERYMNAAEFWDALIAAAVNDGLMAAPARGPAPSMAQLPPLPPLPSTPSSAGSVPSFPGSDPIGAPAASIRQVESFRQHEPAVSATQLATTSHVPASRRGRVPPELKPTPMRIALAALIATAGFFTIAGLGHLVWSANDEERVTFETKAVMSSGAELLPPGSAAGAPSVAPGSKPAAQALKQKAPENSARPSPPPAPAPAPPASGEPSKAATPNDEALLRSAQEIPEGRSTTTETWFQKFRMLTETAQKKSFADAQARCGELGMSLCTEPQWIRACELHPELGTKSSYTASAEADGFVTRGGSGCSTRDVDPGNGTGPERGITCCDRTVGIESKNQNHSFLSATADRMLEIERFVNQRDAAGYVGLMADIAAIDGASRNHDANKRWLENSFASQPDRWIVNESCAVSMQEPVVVVKRSRRARKKVVVESASWTADCRQARHQGGQISVVETSYVFSGSGKLKSVVDKKLVRPFK